MQSLFTKSAYDEILTRLDNLSPESQAQWGKMTVAQMLAHCSEPLKVPLEKLKMAKPNPIMKLLFSFFKKSLYDDKPWKQGLPTSKEFKIVDQRDFQEEKEQLKSLIDEFYAERDKTDWPPHPFCGHFTTEQWGQMQYKHLDHHFRQFGA
ncbi:DUF1569 domain-containing protein [Planktosalinus lacus]|uniref:DUF1569 domain-containing protein n=1 Tax=Planktosalinus lacus TaxID=1526573 RepID=A0A8J2Y8N9_9FLAO|nr:DUF1569 domain-containing protein [Planktosalinus lacus]GGD87386.1 hypothetical protein GCM10011312_09310 [Planktosalinus lacus]